MFCNTKLLYILVITWTKFYLSDCDAFFVSTTPNTNGRSDLVEKIGEYQYRFSLLESKIQQLQDKLEKEEKRNDELNEKLKIIEEKITDNESIPRNCKEVLDRGNYISGTYSIRPQSQTFTAFCDMTSKGGGWTVFQNRFDGSQDFFLSWNDYENGFGDFTGEFWLGLKYIHQLTESDNNYELLIILTDLEKKVAYARYNNFRVGNKTGDYTLTLSGYVGDAGDSLSAQSGMKFTTKDRDNDQYLEANCATMFTGAWWYTACHASNLNGRYLKGRLTGGDINKGIIWGGFRGADYSLLKTRMMVRPR